MKTSKEVPAILGGFLETLRRARAKIACLQLTGRLEDYLVHEFMAYLSDESCGERWAVSNLGSRGEQKFDIAIFSGKEPQRSPPLGSPQGQTEPRLPRIEALIEAKYLRNRHRLWSASATDETRIALRSLRDQLGNSNRTRHSGFPIVRPESSVVLGLVFGSFVRVGECERKEKFYSECLKKADDLGLRSQEMGKPCWRAAFEDESLVVADTKYVVSLRVGLWRLS